MKFNGESLAAHSTVHVEITRGDRKYTLTVAPASPGWRSKMLYEGIISYPNPPKTVVFHKGRIPVKDEAGNLVYETKDDDPEYMKAMRAMDRRLTALRLADVLRLDKNLQFSAQKPVGYNKQDWERYGDELAAEIDDPETGFTDAERSRILEASAGIGVEMDLTGGVDELLGEE